MQSSSAATVLSTPGGGAVLRTPQSLSHPAPTFHPRTSAVARNAVGARSTGADAYGTGSISLRKRPAASFDSVRAACDHYCRKAAGTAAARIVEELSREVFVLCEALERKDHDVQTRMMWLDRHLKEYTEVFFGGDDGSGLIDLSIIDEEQTLPTVLTPGVLRDALERYRDKADLDVLRSRNDSDLEQFEAGTSALRRVMEEHCKAEVAAVRRAAQQQAEEARFRACDDIARARAEVASVAASVLKAQTQAAIRAIERCGGQNSVADEADGIVNGSHLQMLRELLATEGCTESVLGPDGWLQQQRDEELSGQSAEIFKLRSERNARIEAEAEVERLRTELQEAQANATQQKARAAAAVQESGRLASKLHLMELNALQVNLDRINIRTRSKGRHSSAVTFE